MYGDGSDSNIRRMIRYYMDYFYLYICTLSSSSYNVARSLFVDWCECCVSSGN
ncbi:unnamed protein product [Heterobilharzia americana]|nr:unnamed protein product [Heterobilharzia americana]